eukprot:GHVU01073038.1.p1 GENE.GHVU01073038.1~~GHVU01073038.1.p1  ORF type:complete len:216 (+),score=7.66 GHVU01073038.1:90-650(+)
MSAPAAPRAATRRRPGEISWDPGFNPHSGNFPNSFSQTVCQTPDKHCHCVAHTSPSVFSSSAFCNTRLLPKTNTIMQISATQIRPSDKKANEAGRSPDVDPRDFQNVFPPEGFDSASAILVSGDDGMAFASSSLSYLLPSVSITLMYGRQHQLKSRDLESRVPRSLIPLSVARSSSGLQLPDFSHW